MSPTSIIPDNPKAALQNYIEELGTLYDHWYQTAVQRHHAVWLLLQALAILAGLVTAIVAALYGNEPLDRLTRALFVVLPILAAGASPLVILFRNLMRLREAGRQRIQYLIEIGTTRFAAATTPADYTAIHTWLVEQVAALEADQSQRFYQVVPEHLSLAKGTPPSPARRPPS